MKAYIVMMLAITIAASGCGLSRNAQLRKAAVGALGQSNTAGLTADAKALWQQTAEANSSDIPENQWPQSFRPFKPVRVFRDSYGIYLVTAHFVSHMAGVYIVVKDGHTPKDASNVSHERLSEGIFWTLGS